MTHGVGLLVQVCFHLSMLAFNDGVTTTKMEESHWSNFITLETKVRHFKE